MTTSSCSSSFPQPSLLIMIWWSCCVVIMMFPSLCCGGEVILDDAAAADANRRELQDVTTDEPTPASNDTTTTTTTASPTTTNPTMSPTMGPCSKQELVTGIYYHIFVRHSGKALTVRDSSTLINARITQKVVNLHGNEDNWMLEDVISTDYYHIINENSGMGLHIKNGDLDGKADVIQVPVSSVDHDNFCLQLDNEGYYEIKAVHSALNVGIRLASHDDGADVKQYDDKGDVSSQKFLFIPVDTTSNDVGIMDGPYQLPLVAASAANLPDGRILTWSAYAKYDFGGVGQTYTSIYNPDDHSYSDTLVANTTHDMFCPGTAVLPDTRIVISGGSDGRAVTIYDPRDNSWNIGAEMNKARGYHTTTVMSDGSVFAIGGSFTGSRGKKDAEVWDITSETWIMKTGIAVREPSTILTADDRGIYRSDNHMWLFVAPNDIIFQAGPSKMMHWIYTNGEGSIVQERLRGDDDDAMNGNAVMYDIGLILTVGGARNYDNGLASNRAYIIDINGGVGNVVVTRTGDMTFRRSLGNSIVFPNGNVMAIGGMVDTRLFTDDSAVLVNEIWYANTGIWKQVSSLKIPRVYHSVALLMKDGRVFISGGGLCGLCSVNHDDVEIYTPSYLLENDGITLRTNRPIVMKHPNTVADGESFYVSMNTNQYYTFVLMRLSAITHSVNNDVRRIPLISSGHIGGTRGVNKLTIPTSPAIALPGTYYLYAIDSADTPSIGVIISITAPINTNPGVRREL